MILDASLGNAIDWIKSREGFNGIVVYWVDMDKIKSMKYRDLVSEGENLWEEVVVASRCGQPSEVDDDEFVYGYTSYRTQGQFFLNWRIMVERILKIHDNNSFPRLNYLFSYKT